MSKSLRVWLYIVIDALIIIASVYSAYLLRFDFNIEPQYLKRFPYVVSSHLILTISIFYYFKIYKRVWKYASIGDLLSIIKSVLLASLLFFTIHHFAVLYMYPNIIVPRSVNILSAILIIIGITSFRVLKRVISDYLHTFKPRHKKVMIIGAGSAGALVVKELKRSDSDYNPVAFIDDDAEKAKLEVHGIPVAGDRYQIESVVELYDVKTIIIALPSISRSELLDIVEICKRTSCEIKIVPEMNDLINGKISINMIRDVSVVDLLGREPVSIDLGEIAKYITNKVVLVTGAGGSIGSELCRQISGFSPDLLILLGHGENSIYEIELELRKRVPELRIEPIIADIQDLARIKHVFDQFRPQVVFHAAAHKHVPLMEKNPIEAIKNNVFGTRNLALCSHEFGVSRFVMISTDKAVNPTNVMGTTKRIAELIIHSFNLKSKTQFVAVRFGNVLGSRGSVVPVFKKQIEEGGPVTITHPEMIRYFMTIPEASQLVIQAGAYAEYGELFILDMGKPVKIADLAKDLIRLSGLEPDKDIKIEYTGIRPGEKLYEEILTNEEGASATKHNRIYVGKPSELWHEDLDKLLANLENLLYLKVVPDTFEVKRQLKQIVPTYKYNEYNNQAENETSVFEAMRASLEVVATIDKKSM